MGLPADGLVLWLLPASWLVHDLEEIATVEGWSRRWKHSERDDLSTVQRRLVGLLASGRRRFTLAVALVGVVLVGATVLGVSDPSGVGMVVYVTVLGGYFLHAFVHLGQSLVFRGYTPGLVTAVSLVIPTSVYLYWRLLSAHLVDAGVVIATGVLGLAVFVPIVVGAKEVAGRLDRWVG
jgi:hypothetical protein